MHIFHIEAVTESTPCLIEYLCPFFRIISCNLHVRKIHSFAQISLTQRNIGHIDLPSFVEQCFFTAGSYGHRSTVGNTFFFLLFEIVYFRTASAEIVNFITISIEVSVTGTCQRELDNTIRNTIHIDLHNRTFGCSFFLSVFLRFFFFRFILFCYSHFGILFQEGRRSIL